LRWFSIRRTILVRGFGFADKQKRLPSRPNTVYRAGSISKLFTAMAAMQLVEKGRLHIDKPVTDALPEFYVINPFSEPMTLRQLMCHRSGMVRESPVGSYFDDSEPGWRRRSRVFRPVCWCIRPGHTRNIRTAV
jgi:CubicO group peptidase (beta-lactamase class C family)